MSGLSARCTYVSGARTRSPCSERGQEVVLVTLVVEVPYGPSGETLEEMTAHEDGLARDPAADAGVVRSLPLTRHPGDQTSARGTGVSSAATARRSP
ncbi:hypothetical protein [Streptomyces sp. NPDC051642]|uniref:hypothetical protein n=1 Tax=unclassified Streptomyces TaxID=2593676 RepID=UPI003444D009